MWSLWSFPWPWLLFRLYSTRTFTQRTDWHTEAVAVSGQQWRTNVNIHAEWWHLWTRMNSNEACGDIVSLLFSYLSLHSLTLWTCLVFFPGRAWHQLSPPQSHMYIDWSVIMLEAESCAPAILPSTVNVLFSVCSGWGALCEDAGGGPHGSMHAEIAWRATSVLIQHWWRHAGDW